MTSLESDYLSRFRLLHAKQEQVKAAIRELDGLCDSLKNWRKTAFEIGTPGWHGSESVWEDARLKKVLSLKTLLIEFSGLHRTTEQAWQAMSEEERLGLASPKALDESKAGA